MINTILTPTACSLNFGGAKSEKKKLKILHDTANIKPMNPNLNPSTDCHDPSMHFIYDKYELRPRYVCSGGGGVIYHLHISAES